MTQPPIRFEQIPILYQDNHVVVAVKPHNKPSQADDSGDDDMLSWCKRYIKHSRNKPGEAYVGLVHRLDRPAGGLMVFATTSKAAARLSAQFAQHHARRSYLAICHGCPPEGRHVHYLYPQGGLQKAAAQPRGQAKKAELSIRVLSRGSYEGAPLSLCWVQLATGRKHQIRAQLAALGNPLWGDARYDFGRARPGQQLALWGAKLEFSHPTLNQPMAFYYPPAGAVWQQLQAGQAFQAIQAGE